MQIEEILEVDTPFDCTKDEGHADSSQYGERSPGGHSIREGLIFQQVKGRISRQMRADGEVWKS